MPTPFEVKMSESFQESRPAKSINQMDHPLSSDEESFIVLDYSLSSEPVDPICNNHGGPVGSALSSKVNSPHKPTSSNVGLNSHDTKLLEGQLPTDTVGLGPGLEPYSMDLSVDEIQVKLNEVLEENIYLKVNLSQNNLAMKQQLTTLRTWQDEVSKLHLNHKEKFAETKDLIMRLRAENEELKKVVAEMENKNVAASTNSVSEATLRDSNTALTIQVSTLMTQLATLNARSDTSCKKEQELMVQLAAVNARSDTSCKKEQELMALTEQLNRQLDLVERSRRQLTLDNERLQAQKTRLERDVVILKVELESQKQKTEAIVKESNNHKIALVQEPLEDHASHKELVALRAQVQQQQDVIEELTEQQRITVSRATEANRVEELHSHEKRLAESNAEIEKQKERFSSLSTWLQVTSENINKFETGNLRDSELVQYLQAEISSIKQALAEEQAQGQEKAKLLTEAQQQFQNLFSDYQSVLQDLEDLNKQPNQSTLERQSLTYYEVQVRGFTEKIDNMTAKIMNLEESLAQKVQKIAELAENIQTLEAENETIAVLQIQMQVYQADFNAEREARESLAGEKERLAEDLRHLQRRNQQLLNELKLAQQNYVEQLQTNNSNGWNTISTPGRNQARENTPPSPGPHEF